MIKYLGSKRLILPRILEQIGALEGVRTVLDLFSGTARVGHALKRAGYQVTANDHTVYAQTLARCYVEADASRVRAQATRLLRELSKVPPRAGYFTETFCERSRFFQPRNGARIDAIRDVIAKKSLEPALEAVLLVSLMEAADRVDSTCGVQMAYLKQWAPRSHNELELRMPEVLTGKGTALGLDALDAAGSGEWDVVYVDPPYNQHRYLGNYHIWETLMRWDAPETYGLACKRVDCRHYKSDFNSKARILPALEALFDKVRAKHLLVSFSNEGYVTPEDMQALLSRHGKVEVEAIDYKRYVGAQIGIFNPKGEKVGRVSHLRNRELLFRVDCEVARRPARKGTGRGRFVGTAATR